MPPKKKPTPRKDDPQREIDELKMRLAEAEETLQAIREGQVDAVIVSGTKGDQIFSLVGTDSIYRLIVETMKEAAFTVTFDGTILFCNAQFGEFVRRPLEQVVGHPLDEFVADSSRSAAAALLVIAPQKPVKQRLVFLAIDGSDVPAHVSANVLNQPDGLSICVVASDLSELENSTELIQQLRRQQQALLEANEELAATEEELRIQNDELNASRALLDQARATYQDLFEAAPDGYIVTDPEGTILEANREASSLLGRPAAALKGNSFFSLLPMEALQGYQQHLADLRCGRATPKWEVQIRPHEGPPFWAGITASAACGEEGRIIGLRWLMRDVTERKRAEEALRQTAEELARSNKDLEQFASLASHDLQAPLRQVKGFIDLLRERCTGKLDAKAEEFIDLALDGTKRMSELIHDLLAYSQVGNKDLTLQSVNLREPLDRALTSLGNAIAESGVRITVADLPTVQAHSGQLAQVFQNLLDNAIKFRSERPPQIDIGVRREAGDWVLWVKDNGIGLAPEQSPRAFDLFTQLHNREKYPGTGIGLAICKKIIERHGGRIWMESKPGDGATFWFTLPASISRSCCDGPAALA